MEQSSGLKSMQEDTWLSENLSPARVITAVQLKIALKQAQELSLPLRETLLRLRMVKESGLLALYAKHFGMDILNIAEHDYQMVDKSLTRLLPLEFCLKHKVLPVFQIADDESRELTLAVTTPFAQEIIAEVARLTGCRVTPVLTTVAAIEGGIAKLY